MTALAADAVPSGAPDSRHLAVVVGGRYEYCSSHFGKIEVSTHLNARRPVPSPAWPCRRHPNCRVSTGQAGERREKGRLLHDDAGPPRRGNGRTAGGGEPGGRRGGLSVDTRASGSETT